MLTKKIDILSIASDKYFSIKRIVEMDNDESAMEIESSCDLKTIDSAFPLIQIPKYQLDSLENSVKGTECVRMLMDFLFEEEIFAGKNATYLKINYEEKYTLIQRYAIKKFSMKKSEINKCITNKCTQNKLKDSFVEL